MEVSDPGFLLPHSVGSPDYGASSAAVSTPSARVISTQPDGPDVAY
jgi:hypothetical protein